MKTHAGGAEHGDGPDERHPEGTGTIRIRVAQDQDARAHDREREERADVRQVVGLGRVADERRRWRPTSPVISVVTCGMRVPGRTFAAQAGSRPSRAIAKKIRGWPYWKTRSTAVIEIDRAERDDPADGRQPRKLQGARERVGNRELWYGTMPVSTAPMIT